MGQTLGRSQPSKAELRTIYKTLRQKVVLEKGFELQESLLAVQKDFFQTQTRSGSLWATYYPFGAEANPLGFLNGDSYQWCFPRVEGGRLHFYQPSDPFSSNSWQKNKLGILEPIPEISKSVELSDCEGVLVPGLAFDTFGTRLGTGKGYYDRELPQYTGLKVGLAYFCQFQEVALPIETHDVPMDFIITDKKWIRTVKG